MTKKPTPTKDEDTIARLEEERDGYKAEAEAAAKVLSGIRQDLGALLGVVHAQAQALNQVDEWLYFGNRDTRRCLWCKAWQKHGQGHKDNCKREIARQAWTDLQFYLNTRQGTEVPDDTDPVD